jgi:IS30 family transposase
VRAQTRKARPHLPIRMTHDRLVHWVITQLRKEWTPEEFAGRGPIEFPDDPRMRISHETLCAWICDPAQQHRGLRQYLPRGHKRRRRKKGRNGHGERFRWRTSIHDRPAVIEARAQFGHWESDSVLGAAGTGALHTTVECAGRYYQAVLIPSATARATVEAQIALFQGFPAHAARSVTAESGSEFAFHYEFADMLLIPTYFADPYSAYQRGSNEHFNGDSAASCPKAPASRASPKTR